MVDTYTCSFCGDRLDPGTGMMYVRRDGTIHYFCSSKCRSNFRLGRIPRRVAWTGAGRRARGRE